MNQIGVCPAGLHEDLLNKKTKTRVERFETAFPRSQTRGEGGSREAPGPGALWGPPGLLGASFSALTFKALFGALLGSLPGAIWL